MTETCCCTFCTSVYVCTECNEPVLLLMLTDKNREADCCHLVPASFTF